MHIFNVYLIVNWFFLSRQLFHIVSSRWSGHIYKLYMISFYANGVGKKVVLLFSLWKDVIVIYCLFKLFAIMNNHFFRGTNKRKLKNKDIIFRSSAWVWDRVNFDPLICQLFRIRIEKIVVLQGRSILYPFWSLHIIPCKQLIVNVLL